MTDRFDEMEEDPITGIFRHPDRLDGYCEDHAKVEFKLLMDMRSLLIDAYGPPTDLLHKLVPKEHHSYVNNKDDSGFCTFLHEAPLGVTKIYDMIYVRAHTIMDDYPSVKDQYIL